MRYLTIILSLIGLSSAQAATFNVTNTAELRSAIQDSNSNGESNVITLAAGTYVLDGADQEDNSATGDLDLKGNIIIKGNTARETIIDANNNDRVVQIFGGAQVTLQNLTLQKGLITGDQDGGGGIRIEEMGNLTLTRCAILNNTEQNEQLTTNGGGGIYNDLGILNIEDSLLANNITGRGGGGLMNIGTATISNSTISNNQAAAGTAIFNGLLNEGTLTIKNSTIAFNIQKVGTSEAAIHSHNGGVLNLGSNILYNPDSDFDCSGTLAAVNSLGYNFIGIDVCLSDEANPTDQLGTDLAPLDPLLDVLANNGGPTDTHALLAGSPALDAIPADNTDACPEFDQRGVARPQGSACDIGALEQNTCGDLQIASPAESCDDGNLTDGDGCSALCIDENLTDPGNGGDGGGGCSLQSSSQKSLNALFLIALVAGFVLRMKKTTTR